MKQDMLLYFASEFQLNPIIRWFFIEFSLKFNQPKGVSFNNNFRGVQIRISKWNLNQRNQDTWL